MYGYTSVLCHQCQKLRTMYGWMPIALQIWAMDEGLECCGTQTSIVKQEEALE